MQSTLIKELEERYIRHPYTFSETTNSIFPRIPDIWLDIIKTKPPFTHTLPKLWGSLFLEMPKALEKFFSRVLGMCLVHNKEENAMWLGYIFRYLSNGKVTIFVGGTPAPMSTIYSFSEATFLNNFYSKVHNGYSALLYESHFL